LKSDTLTPELLRKMDAYWRARNYLSVGQIYLYDNPLLKEPLKTFAREAAGGRHCGTTPARTSSTCNLNRVIKKYDLDMFYIAGPGTVVRRWWAILTWKAPTVRFIRTSARRSRNEGAVQAVLVPRRDFSHVAPTTPGVDSRRW